MNNTKILIKCIDELKGEEPDLSYVRGMLETLVEMQTPTEAAQEKLTETIRSMPAMTVLPAPQVMDEAAMLNGMAAAAIAKGIPTSTE